MRYLPRRAFYVSGGGKLKREEWERKRETEEEQKSREAKLNRSLLFLSILSVFSALIDSFDFSASFLGGTLKFGPAVVHGVQGVCILLIFLTAAGVLKSLFVSKKEKLKE